MLINNIQMIEFIVVILFGLAYIAYTFYFKPNAICKRYARNLRKMGYKVYKVPFKAFGAPNFDNYKNNQKEKKDAFYQQKHQLQGYDITVSNLLHHPIVTFVNWNLAKELFSPQKVLLLPKVDLGLSLVKHLAGRSLLVSEGLQWKSKRKVLSKIFNYDFISAQIPLISKICDQTFNQVEASYLQQHPNASKTELEVKMSSIASKIFGLVILTCFMGVESIGERIEGKQIQEFILEQSDLSTKVSKDLSVLLLGVCFYKLGLFSSHRKLKHNHQILTALSKKYIQSIRQRFNSKTLQEKKKAVNIIEHLLYFRETEGEECYNDDELTEDILLFFAAATDTTTYFFSMMVFFIFQHADVQRKLREEIGKYFKKEKDFTADNLKKIEYIDWIQYQTTRLFGPTIGIFLRQTKEDMMFGSIPIEKGVLVSYNTKFSFFDAELFSDPHSFKPERWNSLAEGNSVSSLPHLMAFGFSGGPRTCIGKHLALIQSKIALIKFMQRYKDVKETKERIIGYNFMSYLPNTQAKLFKA